MAGKIAEHFVSEYMRPCNHVNHHQDTTNLSNSKDKNTEGEVGETQISSLATCFLKDLQEKCKMGNIQTKE